MNDRFDQVKIAASKTRFLIRVFAVGIIFSLTSYFILLDSFKEYKASVQFLVTAEGELTSSRIDDIAANVAEFPKMLSFYERLLKSNPSLGDDFAGKSKDERKRLWNEKVETSFGENQKGTIVTMSVFADNASKADMLARKCGSNLSEVSADFYDPEKEVKVETVDGPFVSAVFRKSGISASIAVAVGLASSLLLNGLLMLLEKMARPMIKKTAEIGRINFASKLDERKNRNVSSQAPAKHEEIFYDVPYEFGNLESKDDIQLYIEPEEIREEPDYIFKDNPYPNYPEMPVRDVKVASAPDNLPVADMPDIFSDNKTAEDAPVKQEQTFVELKKGEPTQEELRDRLNKLLRGDM